jgi:uncharacterized membrane protein YkoI
VIAPAGCCNQAVQARFTAGRLDRRMRLRTLLSAALLAASALAVAAPASPAAAQPRRPAWAAAPRANTPYERVQSSVRPLREIVDMVRRQRGGELVDVLRLEQSANPPFYVLRWRFENGVVADLRVNAMTGQIMG